MERVVKKRQIILGSAVSASVFASAAFGVAPVANAAETPESVYHATATGAGLPVPLPSPPVSAPSSVPSLPISTPSLPVSVPSLPVPLPSLPAVPTGLLDSVVSLLQTLVGEVPIAGPIVDSLLSLLLGITGSATGGL